MLANKKGVINLYLYSQPVERFFFVVERQEGHENPNYFHPQISVIDMTSTEHKVS